MRNNDKQNDDSQVESNENVTVENLGSELGASVVTKMVDGKEVVVTDLDENLKIQNDARKMLKNATSGNGRESSIINRNNKCNKHYRSTRNACKRGLS